MTTRRDTIRTSRANEPHGGSVLHPMARAMALLAAAGATMAAAAGHAAGSASPRLAPPANDGGASNATAASVAELVLVAEGRATDIADLRGVPLEVAQRRAQDLSPDAPPAERALRQHSGLAIGAGDFRLEATVVFDESSRRGAGIRFDGGAVELDDPDWAAVLSGALFGGGRLPLEAARPASARPGAPITVVVERRGGTLEVALNGDTIGAIGFDGFAPGRIGFDLAGGAMRVLSAKVEGDVRAAPRPVAMFTGADGDIDEYRDPAIACDPSGAALVCAIAVRSDDRGRERTELVARRLSADGTPAAPAPLRLVDHAGQTVAIAPDAVALGHDGARWRVVIQELPASEGAAAASGATRTATRLRAFASLDGGLFEETAPIDLPAPGRLVSGALLAMPTPNSVALSGAVTLALPSATVPNTSDIRAARLTLDRTTAATRESRWTLGEIPGGSACDAVLLDAERALVRLPRSLLRAVRTGGTHAMHGSDAPAADKPPVEREKVDTREGEGREIACPSGEGCQGYEGSILFGAPLLADGATLVVAQSDPVHPNALRCMRSHDGGARWTRGDTLWGGPSGNACAVPCGDRVLVAFEGGDTGARQHVLVVAVDAKALRERR